MCVLLLSSVGVRSLMSYVGLVPNGGKVPGVQAIGHVLGIGGTARSSFGLDFKAHGHKWGLDLCLLDSDGDNETNGVELGDPCCVWTVTELRTLKAQQEFSNPGDKDSTTGLQPEFERVNLLEELEAAAPRLRLSIFKKHGFKCPHWVGQQRDKNTIFQQMGKKAGRTVISIANILMYVAIATCVNGGLGQFFASGEGWAWHSRLAVIALGVLYTEFNSALMHLVADNPDFNHVPLFGDLAHGFQKHHDNPSAIVKEQWMHFLGDIDPGMILLLLCAIIAPAILARCRGRRCCDCGCGFEFWRRACCKSSGSGAPRGGEEGYVAAATREGVELADLGPRCAVALESSVAEEGEGAWSQAVTKVAVLAGSERAPTPTFNVFVLVAVPAHYLMMATHRWTHCPEEDIPVLAKLLQDCGVFLTIKAHNVHHGDFAHNFALLTGWSNSFINFVCDNFMEAKNDWWMSVFLIWALGVPFCVIMYDALGRRCRPSCSRRKL